MSDLNEALDLWVELTGVDPEADRFTYGDWQIQKIHEEIRESLELDPTQVTTYLLMDAFVTDYLNKRSFTVNEILADYDRLADYLAKSRRLYGILRSPEVRAIGEQFKSSVREALRRYGADRKEVLDVVEDGHALAFLRRDALKSMRDLSVHQFLQGDPDPAHPQYQKTIHSCWNINSLLQLACRMPSAVSLNLIRDPNTFFSYFVFAIRNGGTLTVLTDRERFSHPLAKNMTRRPDRRLEERAYRNHFPYDLLGIELDEDEGLRFKPTGDGKELVPYQQDLYAIKEIKDLAPNEIIWITMMFALIVDRFWKKGELTPELSYTGEMVRVEDRLLTVSRTAGLPVPSYRPILAPKISVEDVRSDALDEAEIGRKSTGHNRWLEERYAPEVDEGLLNLVQAPRRNEDLYVPESSNEVVSAGHRPGFLTHEGRHYEVSALDPTSFGTEEEILADRKFLARYNMAQQIQRAADAEFEKTKDEVHGWYRERVLANAENLLAAIGEGRFMAPVIVRKDVFTIGPLETREDNILRVQDLSDRELIGYRVMRGVNFYQGFGKRGGYLCHVNGTKASYRAMFSPQTAEGLARLCFCAVDDLPEVLRHWARERPNVGNNIIDKIDPMEWVVRNPWQKLDFDVTVFLSKRAYNKLVSAAGKAAGKT
jgi:hypothetical protein